MQRVYRSTHFYMHAYTGVNTHNVYRPSHFIHAPSTVPSACRVSTPCRLHHTSRMDLAPELQEALPHAAPPPASLEAQHSCPSCHVAATLAVHAPSGLQGVPRQMQHSDWLQVRRMRYKSRCQGHVQGRNAGEKMNRGQDARDMFRVEMAGKNMVRGQDARDVFRIKMPGENMVRGQDIRVAWDQPQRSLDLATGGQ